MKEKIQIIWFKKNLRVEDNEILANINPDIPTLWVYFFEQDIIGSPDFSSFHMQFILQSLENLKKHLKKLNIPLVTLESKLPEWFECITEYYDIQQIFSHEETWNFVSYKRDTKVINWCKSSAIPLQEFPTNGIVRRLKSRDVWSKIWNIRMAEDIFIAKKVTSLLSLNNRLRDLSETYFKHYAKKYILHAELQQGWEDMGHKVLSNFLKNRSKNYSYHISKPLESQDSCSRLSPYITYWCLSIKYIHQTTLARRTELAKLPWGSGSSQIKQLDFFLSRLHWQSHFIQKLEDEPNIEWKNLNPEFDTLRNTEDTFMVEKIFRAQSGIPYIDATMMQLQRTWWCNFRSRAILTSFLCNTCMQPWQTIGPRLAKLFLDYEPGIHYSQLQMQSGTSGINTIRIYNPILNGKEKDPEGNFIRVYLPQFKSVPKQYAHEPWKYENSLELDYPEPIIDILEANKVARKILWEIKWNTSHEVKQKIFQKHGSRVFRGNQVKKENIKTSKLAVKIKKWDIRLQMSLF